MPLLPLLSIGIPHPQGHLQGTLLPEVPLTLTSLGVQSQHGSVQSTAHPLLMVLEVGPFLWPLVLAPGSVSLPVYLLLSTLVFISDTENRHWHLPVCGRSVEGGRAKEAGWREKHGKELEAGAEEGRVLGTPGEQSATS